MTTIRDAVEALNERKRSAGLGFAEDGHAAPAREYPSVGAGLDVDEDEAGVIGGMLAEQTLLFMGRSGTHPVTTLASLWVDGLMTGLLLAEIRGRS